ncbi:MAG: TadE/TadG family type IV pilus assembly protein [Acidimicrobiales bacterium]
MIEFAVVAALLVMFLWSIVSFGMAYLLKEDLNHSAQEAVRAAVLAPATQPSGYQPPCPQYSSSDPRVDAANCAANNRLLSVLSQNQVNGLVTITSTVFSPSSPGTPCPNESYGCIRTKVLFNNIQPPGVTNPIPPGLPGISSFMPATITVAATARLTTST